MVIFIRVPLGGRRRSRVRSFEEAKFESEMSKEV